ncbi:Thioredoxin X, chloroplastic [Vitis vinifera]|uniref:Thioredoxin X, chloroplastic n=1 Tax=Vitis vinifera TaxID=29760 RepID=A0A438FZ48_VITVI|nr:Thioredoxin X, chloroplastic [Vitis vinifera]
MEKFLSYLKAWPSPYPSIHLLSFRNTIQLRASANTLTKTTSLMETMVSNSMPISVSSLPPVRELPSPRKLEFSSFTPKTTLFGSRSQRKIGFRCSPVRRAAVTCGVVTEIKESQFSDVVLKADEPVLVEFVATWCGPCRLISPAMEAIAQTYKLLVPSSVLPPWAAAPAFPPLEYPAKGCLDGFRAKIKFMPKHHWEVDQTLSMMKKLVMLMEFAEGGGTVWQGPDTLQGKEKFALGGIQLNCLKIYIVGDFPPNLSHQWSEWKLLFMIW